MLRSIVLRTLRHSSPTLSHLRSKSFHLSVQQSPSNFNNNFNNDNNKFVLLLCGGGLFSLLQQSNDNPDVKSMKANKLILQNKLQEAINLLEELRETHPTHAGVAQLAALLAEDSRNSQCVFEIVDDALALNPPPITHAMFLSALGACYITLGDIPKAKESLQKALEIFPDSDSALGHLISLHISQRQFTEAHALADQALSKKFPMSVLMGYQAKIEIHLLEAEEYAKKAYELDNNPMTRQQYFTLKQFTQRK